MCFAEEEMRVVCDDSDMAECVWHRVDCSRSMA